MLLTQQNELKHKDKEIKRQCNWNDKTNQNTKILNPQIDLTNQFKQRI